MPFEVVAIGSQSGEVSRAVLDLEQSITGSTVEVVVVSLAGDLVAIGRAGKLDCTQPLCVDEGTEVTVDGGDAQSREGRTGGVEDLLGAQRSSRALEDAPNLLSLFGVS